MKTEQPIVLVGVGADDAGELARLVEGAGMTARTCRDQTSLVETLTRDGADVVVIDLAIGDDSLVERVLGEAGEAPVVVVVDPGRGAAGVSAVKAGAADFLRRPLEPDEVEFVLTKVVRRIQEDEGEPPPTAAPRSPLLGSSDAMTALAGTLGRVANGIATVLIRGESGSGKELVARRIHALSPRQGGPFVKVHCAALPDNLLESELFGYEKGAFTGATARKPGRVELAEGGTLFLDEIGDISPSVQVKLLRVLQDREYERLGGTETLKADVRFVTATHRNLEEMVQKGEFREDLFYRLNVVPLLVPPLRARPSDIDELAKHFARTVAQANGRPPPVLTSDALDVLRSRPWPGNVRQLQNFVERLVVLSDQAELDAAAVTSELKREQMGFSAASASELQLGKESTVTELSAALRKAEKRALEKALKRAGGNRNLAARILGVSRRTLYYKLQEHGVS